MTGFWDSFYSGSVASPRREPYSRLGSVREIEAALSALSAEELARIEETLRVLRSRRSGSAPNDSADPALKNGFDIFPKRIGAPVTVEFVRQLCAEEGI